MLAAAYAEDGQFDKAVAAAERALGLAAAREDRDLIARVQSHLTWFRQKRPLRLARPDR